MVIMMMVLVTMLSLATLNASHAIVIQTIAVLVAIPTTLWYSMVQNVSHA
jgi:hypothetical protein